MGMPGGMELRFPPPGQFPGRDLSSTVPALSWPPNENRNSNNFDLK